MDILLILTIGISFFSVLLILPFWIRKMKSIKLVWEDMNKKGHPKNVAGSGGVIANLGFILGILIYIAFNVFYLKNPLHLIQIFAILVCIILASWIGFIDDVLGWKKGGLSKRSRIILLLFVAVPLMVINAGEHFMILPFFGKVSFGILYPLILIPLAVIATTTTFNFLAGYNGLEASQGILIIGALSIVTYITGNAWLSVIGILAVASLLAFYFFNKYPAKIFPGDSLTYMVGVLIAGMAILGNIEKISVFFFIPYIIETILKSRGKLIKQSFGKVNADGSLDPPYKKIYGLEHLAIKILKKIKPSGKAYEKEVVYLINLFQIIIIILGFLIIGVK